MSIRVRWDKNGQLTVGSGTTDYIRQWFSAWNADFVEDDQAKACEGDVGNIHSHHCNIFLRLYLQENRIKGLKGM